MIRTFMYKILIAVFNYIFTDKYQNIKKTNCIKNFKSMNIVFSLIILCTPIKILKENTFANIFSETYMIQNFYVPLSIFLIEYLLCFVMMTLFYHFYNKHTAIQEKKLLFNFILTGIFLLIVSVGGTFSFICIIMDSICWLYLIFFCDVI